MKKPSIRSKWVEIAPGRKRLVLYGPGVEPRRKGDRTVGHKDETPEEERYRRLYGRKMIVCEDLKSKEARKSWPRYRITPDGQEGPLPFGSNAERQLYCKTFGFRESAHWG